MNRLANLWNWLSKSAYTRYLEAEVVRLQQRDIETTNSLLAGMGLPQIGKRVTEPKKPIQGRMMPSQVRTRLEAFDRKSVEVDAEPKA